MVAELLQAGQAMLLSPSQLQKEPTKSPSVLLNAVGMRRAGEGFESWVGLLFPPGNNNFLMMLLLQEKYIYIYLTDSEMYLLDSNSHFQWNGSSCEFTGTGCGLIKEGCVSR